MVSDVDFFSTGTTVTKVNQQAVFTEQDIGVAAYRFMPVAAEIKNVKRNVTFISTLKLYPAEKTMKCAYDPTMSCAAVETASPPADPCANNVKITQACGAWNNCTTCLSGVSPPKVSEPKCVESRESPLRMTASWKFDLK